MTLPEYPSSFMYDFVGSFRSYFSSDIPKLTTRVTKSKIGFELEIIVEERSDTKLTGTETKVQIVFNTVYPTSPTRLFLVSINDEHVFGTSKDIGNITAHTFHQSYLDALV